MKDGTSLSLQTSELFNPTQKLQKRVDKDDYLYFSYGIRPEAWKSAQATFHFKVSVSEIEGKRESTLFERTLNPHAVEKDQGWQNSEIPLAHFQNKQIEISFQSDVGNCEDPAVRESLKKSTLWGGVRIGDFRRKKGDLNLILISLDTLRLDHLSGNGYSRPTSPNIDSIAKGGVWFKEAIAQAPWTKPAHMSVLTGLYPSFHHLDKWLRDEPNEPELSLDIPTLAEVLQRSGYLTQALTGSGWVSAQYGFCRGFDRFDEYSKKLNGDGHFVFDNGTKWIENHAKEKFFLFLHTYEAHFPYRHSHFLKDTTIANQRDEAQYDSGIYYVDGLIGQLRKKLDELNLTNDTLLVIFSDHGEELDKRGYWSQHGHTLYDELVRILLVFYCPKTLPHRTIQNYQAQQIDVMPTILSLLNVTNKETHFQGRDLSPILFGKEQPLESAAISEAVEYGAEDLYSIRIVDNKKKYKYIFSPSIARPNQILTSSKEFDPNDPVNSYWVRVVIPSGGRELYDLTADPNETTNLAKRKPELQNELERRLVEYIRSTHVERENAGAGSQPSTYNSELREKLKSLGY